MNIEQQSEHNVEQPVESKKASKEDWIAQLERITKIGERLIWMIILVIIVAAVANFLKAQSSSFNRLLPIVENLPIERPIPVEVDQEVFAALKEARVEAKNFALAKLDLWKADVMKRVDDNFLDWYFGYFNQQGLAAKYLFQGASHWFNSSVPTPEESLTSEIQKELERRVLPPEIAQASLNELIEDSVNRYTKELSMRIDILPSRYKIPQGQWDKYLKNLALITNHSEGNREISLAEKGTTATAGAGSAYIAAKMGYKAYNLAFKGAKGVTEMAAQGSTVVAKGGAKLAAEGVAKGTTKIGAKLLGKTLGSVLGVGIIAWDLWDHHHTRATQLPILRQNIAQYLDQVKASILKDPTTGLISVIYDLEKQVLKASKAYRGT